MRRLLLTAALSFAVVSPLTFAQPAPGGVGQPGAAQPGEKRPDLMGRVVNVGADGRTLTLAMPPRGADGQAAARDARPEEVRVTLSERTRAAYFGVGEGEARPAAGMMAMVWLEEGSKDAAARVRFMKREGEERPDVQGRVVSVSPDGQTLNIETRDRDPQTGQERPAGQATVRLAPYTQALYFGVEAGGARPTADYLVVVWFEKGSKETAARVRFMKNEGAGGR